MTTQDLWAGILLELGTATLGESGAGTLPARIGAAWPGAALAAPAVPVRVAAGDNLAIHVAVAEAPPGHALVVAVDGEPERGYWGEVLTTAAQARGLVGLVIDGGVRDVAQLEHHRFPVFSSMIALRGATKERPGTVGQTVAIDGTQVAAGDWVVGDRDGVVVVPGATIEAVVDAGRARAEREQHLFAELHAGRTTIELLGLDGSRITRA
ncbi:MAG TPA: dimethylmenaquinone methyltransferase [Acidimicrobiia bacterium]|nr:dimethylmenaquinone methyltransferase [Acidimicrobiia bacterium]